MVVANGYGSPVASSNATLTVNTLPLPVAVDYTKPPGPPPAIRALLSRRILRAVPAGPALWLLPNWLRSYLGEEGFGRTRASVVRAATRWVTVLSWKFFPGQRRILAGGESDYCGVSTVPGRNSWIRMVLKSKALFSAWMPM